MKSLSFWSSAAARLLQVNVLSLLITDAELIARTVNRARLPFVSRMLKHHESSPTAGASLVASLMPDVNRSSRQSMHLHACCHNMCRCNATFADCSEHKGNLTYVPVLPEGIVHLKFSDNNLLTIDNDDFFSNASGITDLDLSNNRMVSVSGNPFYILSKLKHLDLSNNDINTTGLQTIFFPNCSNYGLQTGREVRCPLTGLTYLNLQNNKIESLDFTMLKTLVKLYYLELQNNIVYKITPDLMLSLTVLGLNYNRIFDFPETCKNGKSLMPNLTELYLYQNSIYDIYNIEICLPSLQLLELECNRLDEFLPYTISETRFPQLRYLFLDSVSVLGKLYSHAFSHPLLQTLDVSFNGLNFTDDKSVHPDAFVGCSGLQSLNVEDNIFTDIHDEKIQRLFGVLPSLRSLFVGFVRLKQISENTFRNLLQVHALFLYGNALAFIPDGAFDHMTNLTTIVLSNNDTSLIRESTFSVSLRQRISHIDLSANAFVCSCDLMWFQQWLLTSSTLINHSWRSYECSNLPSTYVTTFYLNEQACLLSHEVYTFTVVCVGVLLFALTLLSFLYRYRWQLRLIVYETFRGQANRRQLLLQTGTFKYDLFVSYAQGDLQWVCEHLIPELETRRGLRLCIHQRDFLPGDYIVDNISQSIETSKKVMLVFSRNFSLSQWCQFELKLSLGHVLEQDDQLVVVCLHEFQSRDLTSAMLAVLKTTTYIEFGDEPEARASFWGRLILALNDIIPKNSSKYIFILELNTFGVLKHFLTPCV